MTALLLLAYAPAAIAGETSFPEIAQVQGLGAVQAALTTMVAEARNDKKLQKDLTSRGFEQVSMPVSYVGGAELTLTESSPLGACRYDGQIHCQFNAKGNGIAVSDDFKVSCRTRHGAAVALTTTSAQATDGRIGWEVHGMEACWRLNGSDIRVTPTAIQTLEGVGNGDEFHAPELVELSQTEVEDILALNMNAFRYCHQKYGTNSSSGKLIVAYTIADNGTVGTTSLHTNTLQDEPVEQCVLERFGRLTFPKPMGGFQGGKWTITLLN